MAFTFVCPTEIIAYSEAVKKFAEKDTEVLFASTDSEYSLLAWTNVARKDGGLGPINLPLIADTNHSLAKDYGVLLEEVGRMGIIIATTISAFRITIMDIII